MPPKFMTLQLVAQIVAEFTWPTTYILEDWQPDGIAMIFEKCTLVFFESFEGQMELEFLPEQTGLGETVTLAHALIALRADPAHAEKMTDPKLIDDHTPQATLDKVKNGIRDLCTLMLAHLPTCMLGDFSWVEKYKTYRARTQGQQA